ncbi:hypothetical protein DESC_290165 [Desulfosarcina cetonica]|nr:hypothetical protein DESC_290165 [Desulfosarcina cetonica]
MNFFTLSVSMGDKQPEKEVTHEAEKNVHFYYDDCCGMFNDWGWPELGWTIKPGFGGSGDRRRCGDGHKHVLPSTSGGLSSSGATAISSRASWFRTAASRVSDSGAAV